MHEKIKIAIADDHTLFVNGLVSLLTKYPEIEVVIVAENGKALHDKLETIQPDILLLDLEMPVMDGYETAAMLKKNYPDIKIIILSNHDSHEIIMNLFKMGARGFLFKNINIDELIENIKSVMLTGYCFNHKVSKEMLSELLDKEIIKPVFNNKAKFDEIDIQIIIHSCHDFTLQEIADKVNKSLATVKKRKEKIYADLNVTGLGGLVLWALSNKIIGFQKQKVEN